MIYLTALLGSFGSLFLFWIFWLSVSALGRAQGEGRLSPNVILFGRAYAFVGLVWDVLCNLIICSILFIEFPLELTLSQRLRRLVKSEGWRKSFAIWIAVSLINPFSVDRNDPHIHIPRP